MATGGAATALGAEECWEGLRRRGGAGGHQCAASAVRSAGSAGAATASSAVPAAGAAPERGANAGAKRATVLRRATPCVPGCPGASAATAGRCIGLGFVAVAVGMSGPVDAGAGAAGDAPFGLTLPLQTALWPFERNWAHLPSPPTHIFLEVGANDFDIDRDDLAALLTDAAGGFLVTFEPLLDKYAALLAASQEPRGSRHARLGAHHRRGLALPLAVDACEPGGIRTFHVSQHSGCSSLREFPKDFAATYAEGAVKWQEWVAEDCARAVEQRMVPCVSLGDVVDSWLQGRRVARLKVDAQGSDLDVVRSLGPHVDKVRFLQMEVVHDAAPKLYVGAPACSEIVAEMASLGYVVADDHLGGQDCDVSNFKYQRPERDLHFVRFEDRPLWAGFYAAYPVVAVCSVYAAAGACGGPSCGSPRLGLQVNRTGACDRRFVDTITLDPTSLTLLALVIEDRCIQQVNISRTVGPRAGAPFGDRSGILTLQVDQGRVGAPNGCALGGHSLIHFEGHIVRFIIGKEDFAETMTRVVVLPPGLLQVSPGVGARMLDQFLQVVKLIPGTPFVVWPGSCNTKSAGAPADAPSRRSAPLLRQLLRTFPSAIVGREVSSVLTGRFATRTCVLAVR